MGSVKTQKKVANLIKGLAELSAKGAISKKLLIMAYEPEVPEAVKEFIKKEEK